MYTIFKYIVSGGTAALVDLFVLNFLDSIGIHYILSVNIAFIIAFGVSFSLQKYWTFKDAKDGKTHHQALIYLIVSIINAFLNTAIIHFLLSMNIINGFLFLKPVVIAQIISGIIVAIESFMVYRFFIFKKENSEGYNNILIRLDNFFVNIKQYLSIYNILLTVVFLLVVFLSIYKLTESPPVWMDEGIISQISRNISDNGVYKLQIAPSNYVSAGFVTTSFPVTLPIGLSFSIFGVGVLQARIIMVFYIIGFFFSIYFLAKRQFYNKKYIILTIIIISTFAPLYGQGKNVMGEVPGLFFLILGLIFISKIESKVNNSVDKLSSGNNFIYAGLFFSLCAITKPIFLVVCPVFILISLLIRNKISKKELILGILTFVIPVIISLIIKLFGDTLTNIINLYINPSNTNPILSIKQNLLRFFTESQPAYFLLTLFLWYITIVIRYLKKITISIVEYGAASFSLLILLSYLRTVGYYRYFFPAQIFALFYFTQAMFIIIPTKAFLCRRITYSILILVIIVQLYQTSFKSWVARYYNSNRTEIIKENIDSLPKDSHFYIYQVPEMVFFLPTSNYSQYLKVTDNITIGSNTLYEINKGITPIIITNSEIWKSNSLLFNKYKLKKDIEPYVILSLI